MAHCQIFERFVQCMWRRQLARPLYSCRVALFSRTILVLFSCFRMKKCHSWSCFCTLWVICIFSVCKLEVLVWVVIRFTTWYVFHTFIELFYQFEPYELIWHLTENTLYFKIWTFYLVNLKNLCCYKAHNYGLQISYIFLFNDILVLRHIFCRFLWRIIIITLSKFNS